MKTYTFRRESNKFDDILSDIVLKPVISTKMFWNNHLLIGLQNDVKDDVLSYVVIKYGDEMVDVIETDYSPVPYKDYIPARRLGQINK